MASLRQHPQRRLVPAAQHGRQVRQFLRSQRVGDGMVEEGENGCLERCRIGRAGRQRLGLAQRRAATLLGAALRLHQFRHHDSRCRLVGHARQQRPVGAFVGPARLARSAQQHADQFRPFGALAQQRYQELHRSVPAHLDRFALRQRAGMRRKQAGHGSGVGRRTLGRCEGKGPAVDERQRCTFALHEAGRAVDEHCANRAHVEARPHVTAKCRQLGLEVDPLAIAGAVDAPLQESIGRQQQQRRDEGQQRGRPDGAETGQAVKCRAGHHHDENVEHRHARRQQRVEQRAPHRVAEIPQPVAQDRHAKAQGQEEHEEDENRIAQDVHGQRRGARSARRCIGDGAHNFGDEEHDKGHRPRLDLLPLHGAGMAAVALHLSEHAEAQQKRAEERRLHRRSLP